MNALQADALAHATAWALISSVWQNALIAAFVFSLLACVSRAAARTRYAIACSCMAAMIAVPVATGVRSYQTFARDSAAVVAPDAQFAGILEEAAQPAAPGAAEAAAPEPSSFHDEARGRAYELPGWLRDVVLTLWLAGLAVHLIRLSTGLRQTYRLTFSATKPPPPWLAALAREVAQNLRIQLCLVLVSARASVPMVIGVLRPVILVPAGFVTGLPPDALRALLAHELAHVQRRDFMFNLLQVLAESLLFYHPATWWLSRQIRDEREHCCDDMASRALGDRRTLARALVAAEELRGSRGAPVLALAATDGSLTRRVHRLLAPAGGPRYSSLAAAAAIPLLCALLAVPATAVHETAPPQWEEVWSGDIAAGAWLRVYNLHGPLIVERRAVSRTVVLARLSSPGVRFTTTSGSDGSVRVCSMQPASGECNADGMIWRGTPELLRRSVTELHVIMPLYGPVEAAAHEGDLTVHGGTAPVVARTGDGVIHIISDGASVEAASGAGMISITAGSDIVVRSSNGDVELNEVTGDARVQLTNGSVRAWLAPGKAERTVDIDIGAGSATLHLPTNVNATLAVRATDGDVDVAYAGVERAADRGYRAVIGSGGSPMRIATGRGDITVTPRQ